MKRKDVKKTLREAAVLLVVFIIAVIIFSYFTNKGNDNMAADMGSATYPQISFSYNGYSLNSVPGYAREMDIPSVRDTITPVYGGNLDVTVDAHENKIANISYKVYTLDGEEVLKEQEEEAGSEFTLDLDSENILSEERVLQIILQIEGDKNVYFYTRIANAQDANVLECLDYVKDFHENALAKAEDAGIGTAIEPSEEGDNTTFSHVTIHSNYDQVTWGELEPQVEGVERWTMKEMNDTSSSFQVEFLVRCKGEENEEDVYQVREFYRVRYDQWAKRVYLLDYDRTMEQIFDPTKQVLSAKGVLLGIADQDVPYLTDDDGKIVSFVQADELWTYNKATDEISLVFSFASAESTDERNRIRQHEIRLLENESSGNLTFAVYGYMNRGEHEGEVGVAIYYYDVSTSSVEEKVFIQTDHSYSYTVQELDQLLYYSVERNQLYVLVDGTIYETDVEKGRTKELVKGLEENQYVVSEDGHLLAYQTDSDESTAQEIIIMDLSSGETQEVSCGEEESIYPLGFIKNDFAYGTARAADAGEMTSGESVTPMYKVEIQNSKGKIVKTYEQEGVYILGATPETNRMILERASRDGSTYTSMTEEYITNNEEQKESNISLESYTTELKERQMRLTFADGITDKEPKVLKPKMLALENPTTISFESEKNEKKYYTYGHGSLQGIYDSAGDAIAKADEYGGVVTDQDQAYIWERGNRDLKYTINNAGDVAAEIKSKLAAGETPMEVMEERNPGATLDLTGCTAEQLAYIINQDRPVIAVLNTSDTIILVGYGETSIIYMDRDSSEAKTATYEEMDKMAEAYIA